MPSSTAQDGRVRTPVSFQEQLENLYLHDTPVRCKSPCCAPVVQKDDASSERARELQQQHTRPALNRSAASHLTTSSVYSTGTDSSSYVQSEDGSGQFPEFGDNIDTITFEQILEMDDDEDEREFSKSIVYDFFTQAEGTFNNMDTALEQKDLSQLSTLGHFLKGSSATLGLTKVKDSCEKIQNYGARKDEAGTRDEPDDKLSLQRCQRTIQEAKDQFHIVQEALKRFYHDENAT